MPDFVNDNVALPEPKNEQTVPLGKEARFIRGQDYNALRDAALSLRTARTVDVAAQAAKDAAQDALILDTRNAQSYQGIGDNTSVLATGSTTPRSLKDWMAALSPPTWEGTPRPWIIAHRGASWMHPENTIEAFDEAAALGLPIEADVQASSDGFLVCIHDTTVDRTTDGTGTVSAMTLAALRALNASEPIAGYPATQIPTFTEYLARHGRRFLLIPEAKDSLVAGREMARQIAAARLEDSVVIQSFEASETTAIKAANPRLRMLQLGLDGSPPSLATLQAVGAWAAGPSALDVTAQYVADVRALGIYVISYTVNRVKQAETLIGYGVDGLFSDDPAYLLMLRDSATPSGTTIPVPSRLPASGWSSNSVSTMVLSSGYVTRASGGIVEQIVFPPVRLPSAATHQIDTTLKLTYKAPDATRYVGIRFALKEDRFTHLFLLNATAAGYAFVLRGDGLAKIEKWTNGSAATLASTSWTAPVEGEEIPIRIALTATTITVTRTDSGQSVSVTNSDLTRDGFVDVFAHTSRVGVGPITVTY
jgi:glycerophosphoryl diester phosphodiesterase